MAKGFGANVTHHPQGEADDAAQRDAAQHDHGGAECGHAEERCLRGRCAAATTGGERVDQPAGFNRHQHFGNGRQHHGAADAQHAQWVAAPMVELEGENGAHG